MSLKIQEFMQLKIYDGFMKQNEERQNDINYREKKWSKGGPSPSKHGLNLGLTVMTHVRHILLLS